VFKRAQITDDLIFLGPLSPRIGRVELVKRNKIPRNEREEGVSGICFHFENGSKNTCSVYTGGGMCYCIGEII